MTIAQLLGATSAHSSQQRCGPGHSILISFTLPQHYCLCHGHWQQTRPCRNSSVASVKMKADFMLSAEAVCNACTFIWVNAGSSEYDEGTETADWPELGDNNRLRSTGETASENTLYVQRLVYTTAVSWCWDLVKVVEKCGRGEDRWFQRGFSSHSDFSC